MPTDVLTKLKATFSQFRNPIQEITELNLRTIQNFSYVKPDEWAQLKRPEEIFDKHMEVFIENGHKALDYLQEASHLLEKQWLSTSNQVKEKTREALSQTRSVLRETKSTTRSKRH